MSYAPPGPEPDAPDDDAEHPVARAARDPDPVPGAVRPGLAVVGSLVRLLRQLETTGQALEAYVAEAEARADAESRGDAGTEAHAEPEAEVEKHHADGP